MTMKTTKIQATSRISTKIGDTFYTLFHAVLNGFRVLIEDGDDIEEVRENLWELCHGEVDKQVQDVVNLYKK